MVDLHHCHCNVVGCQTTASYGVEGSKQPTHCADHKEDGMIDLKHKPCDVKGCMTTRCGKHKLSSMIEIYHKRREIEGCETLPSYGLRGK